MPRKPKILKQYINEDGIPVTVYRTYPPRPEEKPRNNRYTLFNTGRIRARFNQSSIYIETDRRYGL